MQLLALLLMLLRFPRVFWAVLGLGMVALVPLSALTVARQAVFANNDALWTATIEVSPDSDVANGNMGMVLGQRGDADGAIAHLERALQLNPDYIEARSNLGNAYVLEGRYDDAVAQYRQVIALDPGFASAHGNLGAVLLHLGKFDEAISELRQDLDLSPGDPVAQRNLEKAEAAKEGQPPGP